MANESFIRFYRSVDAESIKKHCLVVEEVIGQCQNCKHPGINFTQQRTCPGCGTEFRYLATNLKDRAAITKILMRIRKEGLSLEMVEKEDLDRATARDAVANLFKS